MSWQLGVLVGLGVMLLAGAAWYERSRPPSQIVALVAALAALAVAGRVAFSPIPNVLPSTDLAIVSGYALGGAPGFAVGALTGLVSNFWLGQGPWTPWQMAGWGLAGVAGALLAAASGRRLGRLGLATACAAAGFAFGALMDLSLMVTYGGEQSLDRYLALSARGLPFNLAHAAGNAVLALAAGPAIVRMLVRYRERFEFAWARTGGRRRSLPAAIGAGCVLVAVGLAPLASSERAEGSGGGSGAAVSWLRQLQNDDGGFGAAPGEESDPAMTGWVALGLESARINPFDFGSPDPISYLRAQAGEIRTTGDIERTILVLAGAGLDRRDFGGSDLVARLRARRGRNGSIAGQVNLTAFAIMALQAAGETRGNGRSAAWLARARNPDGGWGLAPGAGSDADSTGAAMQGLAAAGRVGAARRGLRYLRSTQRPNGGFRLYSGPTNAQSTAWATQGILAAGADPARLRSRGRSPLGYLARLQAGDGHYRYSSASDQTPVWVTAQALAAVNRQAYPIAPVPRAISASGPSGGEAAAERDSAASNRSASAGKPAGARPRGPEARKQANDEQTTPFEVAASPEGEAEAGDELAYVVGAVALALLAATWGGWLLYRRRLP